MAHEHKPNKQVSANWRFKWVLIGFLAIAAYFLITEHKAHLSGLLNYLPYLLLLACPLMHFFMHGGHGEHDGRGGGSDKTGEKSRKGE